MNITMAKKQGARLSKSEYLNEEKTKIAGTVKPTTNQKSAYITLPKDWANKKVIIERIS